MVLPVLIERPAAGAALLAASSTNMGLCLKDLSAVTWLLLVGYNTHAAGAVLPAQATSTKACRVMQMLLEIIQVSMLWSLWYIGRNASESFLPHLQPQSISAACCIARACPGSCNGWGMLAASQLTHHISSASAAGAEYTLQFSIALLQGLLPHVVSLIQQGKEVPSGFSLLESYLLIGGPAVLAPVRGEIASVLQQTAERVLVAMSPREPGLHCGCAVASVCSAAAQHEALAGAPSCPLAWLAAKAKCCVSCCGLLLSCCRRAPYSNFKCSLIFR